MRTGFSKELIARILPNAKYSLQELDAKYPARNLSDGAEVVRVAPSPTGFMHLGGLYQMLINKKLAVQSNGVFMLRIEDTDTAREIPGATDLILRTATEFGLNPDEYLEVGAYAPYVQSMRRDVYHSVAAYLLENGLAYPCFMTAEDMAAVRENQKAAGFPTGIYGEFARDRDITEEEVAKNLEAGLRPTIRLYSTSDPNAKIYCKDAARGSIAFPQNNEDIVLIKSNDGLPTYHFAHLCDDHFMRTTTVVRAEEWLSSLPLHYQLFMMMNWDIPTYVHTSTLDKIDVDTGKQRKLSKRKDPEASVEQFIKDGWAKESVLEYLTNIIASGYEEEKAKRPETNYLTYPIKIKKIPQSGALFDMKKLEWWAKEFIGGLPIDELTNRVIEWAKSNDAEWAARINGKEDYLKSFLNIERDNPKRIRKDFITWKQTLADTAYFWDDLYVAQNDGVNKDVIAEFLKVFNCNDDKDTWWGKITEIAGKLGVKNGDAAMALRIALTGRSNTPDLYSIIKVMGENRVKERLGNI
jgi:glutamyl-tRNA synthetase